MIDFAIILMYQNIRSRQQNQSIQNSPSDLHINIQDRMIDITKKKAYKSMLDKQIQQKSRLASVPKRREYEPYDQQPYFNHRNDDYNTLRKYKDERRQIEKREMDQIRKDLNYQLNSVKVDDFNIDLSKESQPIIPYERIKRYRQIEDLKTEAYLKECDQLIKRGQISYKSVDYNQARQRIKTEPDTVEGYTNNLENSHRLPQVKHRDFDLGNLYYKRKYDERPSVAMRNRTIETEQKSNKIYKYRPIIEEYKRANERELEKRRVMDQSYKYKPVGIEYRRMIKNQYKRKFPEDKERIKLRLLQELEGTQTRSRWNVNKSQENTKIDNQAKLEVQEKQKESTSQKQEVRTLKIELKNKQQNEKGTVDQQRINNPIISSALNNANRSDNQARGQRFAQNRKQDSRKRLEAEKVQNKLKDQKLKQKLQQQKQKIIQRQIQVERDNTVIQTLKRTKTKGSKLFQRMKNYKQKMYLQLKSTQ